MALVVLLLLPTFEDAFFELPRLDIIQLVQSQEKYTVSSNLGLFELLEQVTPQILPGLPTNVYYEIYHMRLVKYDDNSEFSQALLECDAAIETFSREDHEEIYNQCKAAQSTLSERKEYGKKYAEGKKASEPVPTPAPKKGKKDKDN